MANLVELFDNIVQMQALNGVPLANGKLYVYALGRTRLMDTWSDVDGESLNTNPIILDNAGQAHCFVSDDFDYTLVVCDEYNNEVFSIDKYLYSKGEHSHADVAVAPSEHIGVSSYHVGETTVYVPYIQGELGKTYHGIEPIVVNNQENKISARNIPLGVQSPLYFAEDSESACIIAMSGEYQPVTGMSGYATTGDLVDLATSVSETYQPKGDYATHDDLSGFMEESKLETADGKITGYDGTAFAGGGSVDPSEFIPWSASGNFATSGDLNDKLDTTAFSTVSGDFITAIPDTYASKDFVLSSVSSKLDSTAFSTVSGDFITALPEGLLNESGFEYDGDKISAYNGSAFVGQGGGGITGEYELSAGNGISIDNYPIEQKTVISVTGNYATEDWVTGQGYLTAETDWTNTITAASANAYNEATAAIPPAFDPSYISAQVDTKLDSAIYAADSGTFLTALPQDLVYTADIADMATTGDLTAYATVESLTAKQDAGDYLSATDSASFLLTSDSGNFYTTANESGFITGVDLTPYMLTANMTAYQAAGSYLSSTDSAKFYTTANESGFISEVPAGTMNESAFGYDANDKISGYNGSAFAGGSDVPEGVMVESGLEYDNTEISGYSGSAFKDVALTDVVTANSAAWGGSALPISAGPGIKFEMVDNTLVASMDETVLWSGATTTFTSAFNTNEPITNFKELKVYGMIFSDNDYMSEVHIYDVNALTATNSLNLGFTYLIDNGWRCWGASKYHITANTTFAIFSAGRNFCGPTATANYGTNSSIEAQNGWIYKLVGVTRTGGN